MTPLNRQSLQVNRDDPRPRPMIAVLDTRRGLAGAFGEHLRTQPMHDFIAAVPALSTARPGSSVQFEEITLD